jgi:hypothetical protein
VDVMGRVHEVIYPGKDQKEVSVDISAWQGGQLYLVYGKTTGGQHVAKFFK